jgi:hypothetical protein
MDWKMPASQARKALTTPPDAEPLGAAPPDVPVVGVVAPVPVVPPVVAPDVPPLPVPLVALLLVLLEVASSSPPALGQSSSCRLAGSCAQAEPPVPPSEEAAGTRAAVPEGAATAVPDPSNSATATTAEPAAILADPLILTERSDTGP